MHRTAYLSLVLAGMTALSLTSCSPPPGQTAQLAASPGATSSAPKSSPVPKVRPAKPKTKVRPAKPKTVTVKTYKLDSRCEKQVAEKSQVAAQQPIQGAIAKVIETGSNSDFNLAGFRANVKSGVATVDLRVAPGSKRQLQSLSLCERMALLGSLRKTLTSNSQWKIKTVRFTDRGKQLVL